MQPAPAMTFATRISLRSTQTSQFVFGSRSFSYKSSNSLRVMGMRRLKPASNSMKSSQFLKNGFLSILFGGALGSSFWVTRGAGLEALHGESSSESSLPASKSIPASLGTFGGVRASSPFELFLLLGGWRAWSAKTMHSMMRLCPWRGNCCAWAITDFTEACSRSLFRWTTNWSSCSSNARCVCEYIVDKVWNTNIARMKSFRERSCHLESKSSM
mmetsp:Transcript_84824/g.166007  ORF Transcript_84824/g.166007 Transcript_84824/m.166007 type:complete len:215 (+) Transcript_84824:804-1448(+)